MDKRKMDFLEGDLSSVHPLFYLIHDSSFFLGT